MFFDLMYSDKNICISGVPFISRTLEISITEFGSGNASPEIHLYTVALEVLSFFENELMLISPDTIRFSKKLAKLKT